MSEVKKRLIDKLRSQIGESIAEVLVALLISAVALMLLANMVTSATRIVTGNREAFNQYITAGNALASHEGTTSSGTVSFAKDGASMKLTDDPSSSSTITVTYYTNTRRNAVISYVMN